MVNGYAEELKDIRVVLIDDQVIVRTGLKTILQDMAGIRVIADFSDPNEALYCYSTLLDADIVLLDISMSGMSGLDFLKELRGRKNSLPVLILSMFPEHLYGQYSRDLGAEGYLTKDCSAQELESELRRIVNAETFNDKQPGTTTESPAQTSGFLELLSSREIEVFRLLCKGWTGKEIAYELGISIKSVATYKTRAMEKLGAQSLHDILRIGMTINW